MESGKERAVPIEDALNSKKYFALGILAKYLNLKGIKNEIIQKKKKDITEEQQKKNEEFFKILVSSFSDLKKMDLILDLGKNNIFILNSDSDFQNKFLEDLKSAISKNLRIDEKDIEINTPKSKGTSLVTAVKVSVIFTKDISKVKFNKESLQKEISSRIKGCKVLDIQSNCFLDTVILNQGLLNYLGDVTDDDYGENEKRGGRDYYPPKGWIAYGLDVKGRFDGGNDSWIGFIEGDEWCIAYHGSSQSTNSKYSEYKNKKDIYHNGNKVGEGVYCTPKPEIFEKEAVVIDAEGTKYKVGFMLRAKPDKIRSPDSNLDYWILEDDCSEIRPYRILLKETK